MAVIDEGELLEPIVDEDDDVDDLDLLVFVYETFDVAEHCRLELLEDNFGPFDVFDLCDFYPYSAEKFDVNHSVVDFRNLDVLDDSKEPPFDVECLDFPSSLVELHDFCIDGPYLPDELALDHLDADCPNLYVFSINLNSRFSTELLKSIFASWIFAILFLTLSMSLLLMTKNLAMSKTGMMLLSSSV